MISSIDWEVKEGETPEQTEIRTKLLEQRFYDNKRIHGNCFMIKFGEDDVRPMYEDQLDMRTITEQVKSPVGMPLDCVLCQPYDEWNFIENNYKDRRYLCKILSPRFLDGFADKGGVWMKCVCTLKGEHSRHLKIKRRES